MRIKKAKLNLKKVTVTNLNAVSMDLARGGGFVEDTVDCADETVKTNTFIGNLPGLTHDYNCPISEYSCLPPC
jgi:hypothetical protein